MPLGAGAAFLIADLLLDLLGLDIQEGDVGKNIIDFRQTLGDDKANFLLRDHVGYTTALEGNDLFKGSILKVLIPGQDNAVTFFNPFGHSVDDIFKTLQLDDSMITHRPIDLWGKHFQRFRQLFSGFS